MPTAINPYEGVNWDNQYKGQFHTHTLNCKVENDGTVLWPDGRIMDNQGAITQEPGTEWERGDPPSESYELSDGDVYSSDGHSYTDTVIDLYHQKGYSILAITDHDTGYHYGTNARTSWPWTIWGRNASDLGMVAIEGNEISQPHHWNSLFNDLPFWQGFNQSDVDKGLEEVGKRNGSAFMAHPHRYNWTLSHYADLYTKHKHLTGLEVCSQGLRNGGRGEYDRNIWDNINSFMLNKVFLTAKTVWGYSNDDMHRIFHPTNFHHMYKNYQFILADELSEDGVRKALDEGKLYFCVEPNANGDALAPHITDLIVDEETKVISIEHNGDVVEWYTEKTELVHTGDTFSYANFDKVFVRAQISNEHGVTYTQPFAMYHPLSYKWGAVFDS